MNNLLSVELKTVNADISTARLTVYNTDKECVFYGDATEEEVAEYIGNAVLQGLPMTRYYQPIGDTGDKMHTIEMGDLPYVLINNCKKTYC